MKTTSTNDRFLILHKTPKDELLRFRCSKNLKLRLARIAMAKEADMSDVMRDACQTYAMQFEQRVA